MSEKKDRVRAIRKAKKLNQTEFGNALGISQRAIAHIEKGTNKLSTRNFELICEKFKVNESWLETGEGEMFKEESTEPNYLDRLAREKGLTLPEKALIESIINLPAEVRIGVIDWAFKLTTAIAVQAEDNDQREIQELERDIAAKEKRLSELKQKGASPYVEESLRGTG